MSRSSEIKVGAVVIIALVLLAAIGYYILGPGRVGRTWEMKILFDNAQGLTGGEPVRTAGVQIGVVKSVALEPTGKAGVTVLIQDYVHLYENYVFTISSGALVPERFVDVEAVKPTGMVEELGKGSVVKGLEKPGLPEIIEVTHSVLTRLAEAAASMNALLGDPQVLKATRTALTNLAVATQEASELINRLNTLSAEARPELLRTARQMAEASAEAQRAAAALAAQLRGSNVPESMQAALEATREAAQHAAELTDSLNDLLGNPQVQSDIRAGISSLRQTTDNLRDITGDLKQSSPHLRGVIEKSDVLLGRAGHRGGGLLGLPRVKPSFRVMSAPRAGRTLADLDLDLSFGRERRFYRLGIADVGEQNQMNFQFGRSAGAGAIRYGIHRSKLGVGLDTPAPGGGALTLDLFDPNRLRADATFDYPLGDKDNGWGLIFGVRDAFGEDLGFVGGRYSR